VAGIARNCTSPRGSAQVDRPHVHRPQFYRTPHGGGSGAAVYLKFPAFLTRPRTDATYTELRRAVREVIVRTKFGVDSSGQGFIPAHVGGGLINSQTDRRPRYPSRPNGSPSLQRIQRVSTEVHNKKELGP